MMAIVDCRAEWLGFHQKSPVCPGEAVELVNNGTGKRGGEGLDSGTCRGPEFTAVRSCDGQADRPQQRLEGCNRSAGDDRQAPAELTGKCDEKRRQAFGYDDVVRVIGYLDQGPVEIEEKGRRLRKPEARRRAEDSIIGKKGGSMRRL
ncbi:hypothetical protein NRB_05700 [Novosphingobium sp. 11B]